MLRPPQMAAGDTTVGIGPNKIVKRSARAARLPMIRRRPKAILTTSGAVTTARNRASATVGLQSLATRIDPKRPTPGGSTNAGGRSVLAFAHRRAEHV